MSAHPVKLPGVDLAEGFALEILQVIAFENVIRVLLVLPCNSRSLNKVNSSLST